MDITYWFILSLLLPIAIFLISGIRVIKPNQAWIILRLGKFKKIMTGGLHYIIPIIDQPKMIKWSYRQKEVSGSDVVIHEWRKFVSLSEQVYELTDQEVLTKDNFFITVSVAVYFEITEPWIAVSKSDNLYEAIRTRIEADLLNEISRRKLSEVTDLKDFKAIIEKSAKEYGVTIKRVTINKNDPSRLAREHLESQTKIEEILEQAEAKRKVAYIEADTIRKMAQVEKEATILKAQGEAEAKKILTEADMEYLRQMLQLIGTDSTNYDPSSYLLSIRYVEVLKEMVSGKDNKTVYIPYEGTRLLQSLKSILEIPATPDKEK